MDILSEILIYSEEKESEDRLDKHKPATGTLWSPFSSPCGAVCCCVASEGLTPWRNRVSEARADLLCTTRYNHTLLIVEALKKTTVFVAPCVCLLDYNEEKRLSSSIFESGSCFLRAVRSDAYTSDLKLLVRSSLRESTKNRWFSVAHYSQNHLLRRRASS